MSPLAYVIRQNQLSGNIELHDAHQKYPLLTQHRLHPVNNPLRLDESIRISQVNVFDRFQVGHGKTLNSKWKNEVANDGSVLEVPISFSSSHFYGQTRREMTYKTRPMARDGRYVSQR